MRQGSGAAVGSASGPAPGLVCGVDLGGERTLSYVAWLDGSSLFFDVYRAGPSSPLPPPPAGRTARVYALDGPQGLPADPGDGRRVRRVADREARTPTQSLPTTAEGLATLGLYGPFVRNAVALFWALHTGGLGRIYGLADEGAGADPALPLVCETWPRRILLGLLADAAPLEAKKTDPEGYVRRVWRTVKQAGLDAPGVGTPGIDHAEAALCALAARALAASDSRSGPAVRRFGAAPWPDGEARLLREGFIVTPSSDAPHAPAMTARNMA